MQYKMQPDKLWKPETMDARSCGPGIDESPPVQRSPHTTSVRRFRCIQRYFRRLLSDHALILPLNILLRICRAFSSEIYVTTWYILATSE